MAANIQVKAPDFTSANASSMNCGSSRNTSPVLPWRSSSIIRMSHL